MALLEPNREPSKLELRVFGLLGGIFLGLVGAAVWVKSGSTPAAIAMWCLAAAFTLGYYALPPLRGPLYRGWMRAVFPIGWTVSHLLLGIIFYGVLTPFGLVMRLFGRYSMQRRFYARRPSYWTELRPGREQSRYFKQS